MKKIILVLCLLFSLKAQAATVSGALTTDTTWSPANGVYVIQSTVTVPHGVTLTIDPGTIVKVPAVTGAALDVYGAVVARGSNGSEIYFTSLVDDSIGGDTDGQGTSTPVAGSWPGISFRTGSKGNLDYINLGYAGAGGFGLGNKVGIENEGNLHIQHSFIHDNTDRGIFNKGTLEVRDSVIENQRLGFELETGTTTISNTTIKNNFQYGILHRATDPLTLNNNIFINNQQTAHINASADFVHTGNTSSDVTYRGFEIMGVVKNGTVWHTQDLPILASVIIPHGSRLVIDPGSIIKLGQGNGTGQISVSGDLVADGTKNSKIYFTSSQDDSVGGDTNGGGPSLPGSKNWEGIFFEDGSTGSLKNTVVRYAGQNFNGESLQGVSAAVYNFGADLSIADSYIHNNYSAGVYSDAGTTTITHTEFVNPQYGIQSRGGIVLLSNNSFIGGPNAYGIVNQTDLDGNGASVKPLAMIDARSNWWGSDTGPLDASTSTPTGIGDRVNHGIMYAPWLTRDPSLVPTHNPVIIVPGIMGSYLYNSSNTEVWINLLKMALLPNDSYLDELKLSDTGGNIGGPFKSTDIIQKINVPLFTSDYFEGLLKSLTDEGYVEGKDLFVFPYDWRFDLSETTLNFKEKIDEIKASTGNLKVNVIAHSMGGLLIKNYIKTSGLNSLGNFIDIGTPHVGSPKSFQTLTFGNTSIPILNQQRIKDITQNMPSIYELLPSRNYFNSTDPNYRYYIFDGINGNIRLTFDQTKAYLKSEGRNSALVDRADLFHQEIDNLNPADYGVKTYNIIGCGTPTIGQIYVLDKKPNGDVSYNIKMINGDGTVPLKSAEAIQASTTYYVKGGVHSTLPSTSGVKELIAGLLNSTSAPDISPYSNLSTNSTGCTIPNGMIVSFHSPIDMFVTDSLGNKAGPNAQGDIENNIPGSDYEVIEDNKFVFLPAGMNYTIKGKGTGSGTFDTRIETIVNDEVINTTLFNDIPLTFSTRAEFTVGNNIPSQISLDQNGDGVFESTKDVSTSTPGFLESTGRPRPKLLPKPELTKWPIKAPLTNLRQ